jgi:uncharacterized membrane protein
MSVARACRRFRRKIKHDSRYNRATRKDAGASARKLQRLIEKQKIMSMRKK